VARADTANGPRDLVDLRLSDRVRDRRHAGVVEYLAIGADDPRQPLARELSRGRTSVRRRRRVVRCCEISTPDVHVTSQRKTFRGNTDKFAVDHHVAHDGFGWGSERARVHQFA